MKQLPRLTLLAACALVAGTVHAADPITMDVSPAFEGLTAERGTIPVAVELRNEGPDARGVLRVSGQDFQMDYPVELPQGSRKRLFTYPSIGYSGAQYTLLTNQGRVTRAYESPGGFTTGGAAVLLISDTAGELAFLRNTNRQGSPEQQQMLQDSYCQPGLAPTRAVGYANLNAVMLGTGAERMTDDEVSAIQAWVLTGGTVVFLGGASSPILGDPRWRSLLPVGDVQPRTVANSGVLERLGGSPAPEVTVLSGRPLAGATSRFDGKVLMTAERGVALGKSVYLAFNPLEAPLSGWPGRRNAMARLIRTPDLQRSTGFLRAYSQEPSNDSYNTYSGVATTTASYPGAPGASTPPTMPAPGMPSANDPFSTTLPPAEKVLTILGAYFFVVVPLNFLILRRLKRGELAWFTAPIISLGFAGVLFNSAQSLYAAQMSTATSGIVIGQQGMAEGTFVGTTQFFIPRSGVYDLKLKDVESIGGIRSPENAYYGGYEDDSDQFEPVDVGEILVPNMRANNLAFRRMAYTQRMPIGEWFSLDVTPKGNGVWTCTLRNGSTYPLRNARLCYGASAQEVGTLEPGQTRTLDITRPANAVVENVTWDVNQFLARQNGVALTGILDGVRPGPQLGQVVNERTQIRMAFFAREALGKP